MGTYLNPGADKFQRALNSEIYVDKSLLISYTNKVFYTNQQYLCVSRPRRFGKSLTADMISAYYDKSADSDDLFHGLKISTCDTFEKYLNNYDVIKINIQDFLSGTSNLSELIRRLREVVIRELIKEYPSVDYFDKSDMIECLQDIYNENHKPFVIIIDEWDCIFREYPHDDEAQRAYLDFLRAWLKDKAYIGLVYMTGILPIKKYGTNSALNMFTEISMEKPGKLAEYTGFTEQEVEKLAEKYNIDMMECQKWYDGYSFPECSHIYNPDSIVKAMNTGILDDYWNQTETYEALKQYINLNYDGLRDSIIKLMSGERVKIETGSFQNDMTNFNNSDDVMTLLIHLGYLGYDYTNGEVFIPNREIMKEFATAIVANKGWNEIADAIKDSDSLLSATWNFDESLVAEYLSKAHFETSTLQYNDENALSYTVSLAYFSARKYYTVVRELPSGKGFADLAFVPRRNCPDKPAMIVELKWDKAASTAINQIREKNYPRPLQDYRDNIILVGIVYDRKTKEHKCKIEKLTEQA
ncbi:MAG: AAA family ATPase [Catonella sp.]|nr:AAA family ATPase [Catonella sp.]MDY6356529.1 AAA family ATPase [Catonella sp.]